MTSPGLLYDRPPDVLFEVFDRRPAPGGSKTIGTTKDGRTFLRDSAGNANRDWKKAVKAAAKAVMKGREPLSGPCEFWIEFTFVRPKKHYRTGKYAGRLRANAPTHPTGPPDLTKLVRGTEDALKGVTWADDSIVCDQHVSKAYGDRDGARIMIRQMEV